ncbi:MAG: hypothetical protein N3E46_01800 [Gemmataceae bacterium]|nr:hypothetical protein [Gemmataceae bacterium]
MMTTCPRCGQEVRVPEVDSNPTARLAERSSPEAASSPALQARPVEGGTPPPLPPLSTGGSSQAPLQPPPLDLSPLPPPLQPPPLPSSVPAAGIASVSLPPPLPVSPLAGAVPPAPAIPPPLPSKVVVPPPAGTGIAPAGGHKAPPPVSPPSPRDSKPAVRSAEKAAKPRSARPAPADNEPPLFERDIDSLLGPIQDMQPSRKQRSQAATGVDATMILDHRGPPSEYVQRLTSIVVIAFTLMVLAFLAGLFIAIR